MGGLIAKQGAKPPAFAWEHPAGSLPDYSLLKTPFITSPKDTRDILYSQTGMYSKEVNKAKTILDLFFQAKTTSPHAPAMRQEFPLPDLGVPSLPFAEWKTWTYLEYWNECRQVAKSLKQLGLQRYEGVTVLGFNAPQWFFAAMGAIMAGGIVTGLYPTDSQDQIEYKVRHCGATVAIVEDYAKALRLKGCTGLKHIVLYSPTAEVVTSAGEDFGTIKLWTWTEFMSMSTTEFGDKELDEIQNGIQPQDCLGLIYTSGTTGNAKGVMVSHDNVYAVCFGVVNNIPGYGLTEERSLSFLPLGHVAGFALDLLLPIVVTGYCAGHLTVGFVRPYDLKSGTIGERIKAVRPTMFFGVPRIWEKFADKLRSVEPQTGLKKYIFQWAKACGAEYYANKQVGGSGKEPITYPLAKKIVHDKIKKTIGLDECKYMASGAAPLQLSSQTYLASLGLNVIEVYGMSESCGNGTAGGHMHYSFGSCGSTIEACEIKLLRRDGNGNEVVCPPSRNWQQPTEEEQGELCYRGRTIMLGYMCGQGDNLEEIQAKNRDAIDDQGWLHSGDKGCRDLLGMFHVTGRFKEIIITAGGENVAPVPIEDAVKHLGKGVISNVQMVGDKQPFNVALITLQMEGATGEKPGDGVLLPSATQLVPGVRTVQDAVNSPKFIQVIESWVEQVNNNGAVSVNNVAKIQKFVILPRDFSIETGELTATLKLKRSVSEQNHALAIKQMYASGPSASKFVPT
ncbi:hypothetical protein BASA81_015836 [Batrachochytrium salamandrivorans]|nr:hypothetical protein BASA81_015836 [Batrachochytrium salamandrivorans]